MEERGVDDDAARCPLGEPVIDESAEKLIDPRVDDPFVPGKEFAVREDDASERAPVEGSVRVHEADSPIPRYRLEGRDDPILDVLKGGVRDFVRVDDRETEACEDGPRGVFPRAHGAGKPDNREAGFRRDPDFQWKSPQLGPDSTLTRKGTVSAMTASISALRSSRTRETSASGASRMSSSCT